MNFWVPEVKAFPHGWIFHPLAVEAVPQPVAAAPAEEAEAQGCPVANGCEHRRFWGRTCLKSTAKASERCVVTWLVVFLWHSNVLKDEFEGFDMLILYDMTSVDCKCATCMNALSCNVCHHSSFIGSYYLQLWLIYSSSPSSSLIFYVKISFFFSKFLLCLPPCHICLR